MREHVRVDLQGGKWFISQEVAVQVMMQAGLSSTGIGGTNFQDDQEVDAWNFK